MNEAEQFLEDVLEKRKRVRRMEEALAAHTAKAESVTGLRLGEKVQTSAQSTIDGVLAALEEERSRLEEAQKELEDMTARAKELINLIRDDETAWHVLWERYIVGEKWSTIARKLNYSTRTVMRIADEGIERINDRKRPKGRYGIHAPPERQRRPPRGGLFCCTEREVRKLHRPMNARERTIQIYHLREYDESRAAGWYTISYYDTEGKRTKSINLLHGHKNIKGPHTHVGYYHAEYGTRRLTDKERRLIDRVSKAWENTDGRS